MAVTGLFKRVNLGLFLSISASLCLTAELLTLAFLISLDLSHLGKNVAVAPVYVQPHEIKKRQSQLARVTPSSQAKILPLATSSLTLCSLPPHPCMPLTKGEMIFLCQAGNYGFQPHGFLPAIDHITFKTGESQKIYVLSLGSVFSLQHKPHQPESTSQVNDKCST